MKKKDGISTHDIASIIEIRKMVSRESWFGADERLQGVIIIEMLNGAKNPSESHFYASFLPGRNQFTQW
ncbi:MAG TPA: hypothetical protein VEL11_09870 [Candidatus Bathyarchaeia archaeon]|nr:hypothetical protein [Candidatus Bathyarchaeia archaeon]